LGRRSNIINEVASMPMPLKPISATARCRLVIWPPPTAL
jgi:hypothetical protein